MNACHSCGQQNREQARFCGHCGKPLVTPSPHRRGRFTRVFLMLSMLGVAAVGMAALLRWQPTNHPQDATRQTDEPVVARVESPTPGEPEKEDTQRAERKVTPPEEKEPPSAKNPDPELPLSPEQDIEQRVHELVNGYRVSIGLQAMEYSEAVAIIARQHSQAMAAGRSSMSHEGVQARQRATENVIPLKGFAENIAVNTYLADGAPQAALDNWLKSDAHRTAIQGPFDLTGIGSAQDADGTFYFTHGRDGIAEIARSKKLPLVEVKEVRASA